MISRSLVPRLPEHYFYGNNEELGGNAFSDKLLAIIRSLSHADQG